MIPKSFLHFYLIFVLVDGESCGIFPDEGESNEYASLLQFMPVDPFSNLHAAKQLQQLLKPSEHKIQEMPGSMDLNAREQYIVLGNNTPRVNTSMFESSHQISLDDGNLEFYRMVEDPMLYRLQEDTTSEMSSRREWRDWLTVYALLVVILIAVSPIAFYDSLTSLLLVLVYLASVSLVKVWVKETIVQGFQYPETTTAMHMMAVSLVVLCFERPRKEEALQVLPISALNGASLLLNNKAFLYGGVAFVSMIAANVPFVTFLLEVCKGKRGCDLGSVMMVVLVCSGSICCVRGEPQVSVAAFFLAAISAVLRSARGVWQHELVSVSPTPLQLVFWNGFWSMWITVATMCFSEGLGGLRSLPSELGGQSGPFLLRDLSRVAEHHAVVCNESVGRIDDEHCWQSESGDGNCTLFCLASRTGHCMAVHRGHVTMWRNLWKQSPRCAKEGIQCEAKYGRCRERREGSSW